MRIEPWCWSLWAVLPFQVVLTVESVIRYVLVRGCDLMTLVLLSLWGRLNYCGYGFVELFNRWLGVWQSVPQYADVAVDKAEV